MNMTAKAEALDVLAKAGDELQAVARITDIEVASVAQAFAALTTSTDAILSLASTIASCVESDSVSSILPTVRTLGSATRTLIGKRLQVTTGVLDTVTSQVQLLRQMAHATVGQEAIALKTRALSFLANIEVARLGEVGGDLHYLTQELADFSQSLTSDIQDLSSRTESRRVVVEEAKSVLAAELPRLGEKLRQIENALGEDLAALESKLGELAGAPGRFHQSVADIALQVGGVVAAVQAHDITRQQLEHVHESLALISGALRGDESSHHGPGLDLAQVHAGLTIQAYQLRTIKQTVTNWTSQIRACMDGILRISASEVVGIGAIVLEQEKAFSSQLSRIERLESESHACAARIQKAVSELSGLMELVGKHLKRSKSIRDRLQLLTLNSIIKARHLGNFALPIFAIAHNIEEISADWSQITSQSGQAMRQIMAQVKQTNQAMEAFSETSTEELREAQAQTRTGLDGLRAAAASAGSRAQEIKSATDQMQQNIAEVGKCGDRLDHCYGRFDAVLGEIESVARKLEMDDPAVREHYDTREAETLFGSSYTTELEREVLRAALGGSVVQVAQPTLAGNSVELF
jgi:chromosome segregation ATPase